MDKKKEANSECKINIKAIEKKAEELENKAKKVVEESNKLLFFL
jgi:hypothetical protein